VTEHGVYNDTVIEHATNPRNVGILERADAVGADGDPVLGNLVHIYLCATAGRVSAARFKAFGCSATIAAASVTTELATGRTLAAARALDAAAIEQALGGLPADKQRCAAVAAGALQRALAGLPD
jgi:NifU-like protein involved in Fe-S cluster formation